MLSKFKNKFSSFLFYKKHKKEYDKFPFLPQEQIKRIQEDKLKKILYLAVNSVPYYKRLNLDINFENFSLDELQKFPIVDKKTIMLNLDDFIVSNAKNGVWSHTSGSTGAPFHFKLPLQNNAIEKLTTARAWGMGKDYAYKDGDAIIILRSYSPKQGEPIYKKVKNFWYLSPFHINKSNLNIYLDIIKKSQAKIMRGYPSSLYIFTLLLQEAGIKIDQIKTLVTSSEVLLPVYRQTIEEYWGMNVLDWYGQNERIIAVDQCWAGNYHNNDDYGIVEVDKERNIIATSLNNDVMPFIRYNTSDKAILLNESVNLCPCGRHTSVPFAGIEGRSDDILQKSDATLVPSINIYTLMHELGFIKQFQIRQSADKSVSIKVVIDDKDANLDRLKIAMRDRLGDVELKIEVVEKIDRDLKTGKLRTIIREK